MFARAHLIAGLKRVFTVTLLGFVALTLLMFFGRELGGIGAGRGVTRRAGAPSGGRETVLYYLHGNHRCAGCKSMSELAENVVNRHFGPERQSGSLSFRVENFERQENQFFREVCGVVSPTLLLVEYRGGRELAWTNLAEIWEYATDDAAAAYLLRETRGFIGGQAAGEDAVSSLAADGIGATELSRWLALSSAVSMGLLAAISPCALASNAVALAFLTGGAIGSRRVLWRGVAYSAGRMAAYTVLGGILVSGLLSVSVGGQLLMKYINGLLGPGLIVVSLFLLQLVGWSWGLPRVVQDWQTRAKSGGAGAAVLLGLVLALAFCPMSAALFFGGLLPLAVKTQLSVLLPAAFGLATGLPIVILALLIALASEAANHWFMRLRRLEVGLRRVMALAFLAAGIYYSMAYVLQSS